MRRVGTRASKTKDRGIVHDPPNAKALPSSARDLARDRGLRSRPKRSSPGCNRSRGVFGTQAGDYKFFQYDRGRYRSSTWTKCSRARKRTASTSSRAVSSIETTFKNLMDDNRLRGKRPEMDDDQAVGAAKFFPAVEFLAAVNKFQMARFALENRIESLSAIAEALPSRLAIDAEGAGLKDAPNYGNVKFDPIVDFYKGRLKELVTAVSNLQPNVNRRERRRAHHRGELG